MFQNIPKRIKILCLLTFINTGIAILGGVFNLISGPPDKLDILKENLEMRGFIAQLKGLGSSNETIELIEKFQLITNAIYENFFFYTTISTLIVFLGFFSALLMLKQNIYGFHMYIIYSLLSSASLYLIVSPEQLPTAVIAVNLFISAIFIYLYSRNISWIKGYSNETLDNNEH
jgi:hypothetical protein